MSLISQASHVYAEHGEEGLRRWEARLTPEQRMAMTHEWDQFAAGFSDMTESLKELPAALDRMRAAVEAVVRDMASVSASLSAPPEANGGENDAP